MKNRFLIIVVTLLIAGVAQGQNEVFSKSGEAIRGYDPVAYFTVGKPLKGDQEYTYVWKGATWKFSSIENLNKFKSDPEKYSPQYGGYCAFGTAEGHKAPTSPDAWTIVEGKLYLNYNNEVKQIWSKDKEGYIKTANTNWPAVRLQED